MFSFSFNFSSSGMVTKMLTFKGELLLKWAVTKENDTQAQNCWKTFHSADMENWEFSIN